MNLKGGVTGIAGLMIALSLWGCGESPQPETDQSASPSASASQESAEPMPVESHEGHHEAAVKARGGHGAHDHGAMQPFVIPEGEPVPTVTLAVQPDLVSGWNVKVATNNFRFAPEELENPGDWNAGHAHLYLDGKKVARLYGSWFHLTGLEPGIRQLRVTLNTNDHRDLKAGDVVVEAIAEFTVPES